MVLSWDTSASLASAVGRFPISSYLIVTLPYYCTRRALPVYGLMRVMFLRPGFILVFMLHFLPAVPTPPNQRHRKRAVSAHPSLEPLKHPINRRDLPAS